MLNAEKLIRKQFLISQAQVNKLELLAKKKRTSVADMVRKSIDAYNPDSMSELDESELLELVAARVKEAITDTQKTRKALDQTFSKLGIE